MLGQRADFVPVDSQTGKSIGIYFTFFRNQHPAAIREKSSPVNRIAGL
jgi:hypothetical protein